MDERARKRRKVAKADQWERSAYRRLDNRNCRPLRNLTNSLETDRWMYRYKRWGVRSINRENEAYLAFKTVRQRKWSSGEISGKNILKWGTTPTRSEGERIQLEGIVRRPSTPPKCCGQFTGLSGAEPGEPGAKTWKGDTSPLIE